MNLIVSAHVTLASHVSVFNDKFQDGYVERLRKNGKIRVHYRGEWYTLNRENVFCFESTLANGKTWYSYGGELNKLTMSELADLAEKIRKVYVDSK